MYFLELINALTEEFGSGNTFLNEKNIKLWELNGVVFLLADPGFKREQIRETCDHLKKSKPLLIVMPVLIKTSDSLVHGVYICGNISIGSHMLRTSALHSVISWFANSHISDSSSLADEIIRKKENGHLKFTTKTSIMDSIQTFEEGLSLGLFL